ncbi:MAG TPA: hypothetical protein VGS12_17875 [Caulobacteraceae bacterium]|nr:hypothetical protein [Caulobacteraceae bacterium]
MATDDQRLDGVIVRRLAGDLPDGVVSTVLKTGASLADFEAALAWLQGESDIMGEARRPLEGPAARVYDLLVVERDPGEER